MKYLLTSLVALILLGTAGSASAHAESPLARKAFALDSGAWVLRTNFGVTTSAAPDRFVCEEAFLGGDRFFLAPLGPTTWVTFGETSIQRTEDGCSFDEVASLAFPVEDVDSIAPDHIVYITNRDDAGVYLSDDGGNSFRSLGTIDTSTRQMTTVRFVDPTTVVVGTYLRDGGNAVVVRIDTESGETTELSLPDGLFYPYVIAAAPNRLVLNVRGDVQTILVGTLEEPALHTRELTQQESWPSGAAVSANGSTIYLAGVAAGFGVEVAEWSRTALTWREVIPDNQASCIEPQADAALVCSRAAVGTSIGDLIKVSESSPEALVNFAEFAGPAECPADSDVGTVCPLIWPEVAPTLGIELEGSDGDAGTSDGGNGGDPIDDPASSDSSCSVAGSPASPWALFLLFMMVRLVRTSSRRR